MQETGTCAAVTNLGSDSMLDARVIESLRELGGTDDPDLFRDLIDTFLCDAPMRFEAIAAAAKSADAQALFRAAHGLKSGAANMGAVVLAELCRRLELAGRTGDLAAVPGLLAELATTRAATEGALRALVA